MNRLFLLLLCSIVYFSSCNKEDKTTLQNNVYDSVERKYRDVKYGSDARNVMDIYLPANRNASTPFVLLIHGGSWIGGSKNDLNGVQDTLLRHGIASASISYRYVSSTVHCQELMSDVGGALNYCINNYDSLKIRNNKFILLGLSAGAHMSLLYGYAHDNAKKVSGIVSLCGPTDLTDTKNLDTLTDANLKTAVQDLAGVPFTIGQPLPIEYQAISPIHHVKNVPTLMVYGTMDNLVLYNSHAVTLDAKLTSLNYTHKLVTMTGAGHDLGLANPVNMQLILSESLNWIKTYSK